MQKRFRQRGGSLTLTLSLPLIALGVSGCGSPMAGAGYHPDTGHRSATLEQPVVIAYPMDDGTVISPFSLFGDATAFKGVITYSVTAEDDEIVAEGETQAGSMGIFSKFAIQLDLDPGQYTA